MNHSQTCFGFGVCNIPKCKYKTLSVAAVSYYPSMKKCCGWDNVWGVEGQGEGKGSEEERGETTRRK